MKITPLTADDPWFSHVFNHGKAYVQVLESVPVEVTAMMEQVDLLHDDSRRQFRPCLMMRAQVLSVEAPEVELPYGVSGMDFAASTGPRVDARYEFTTEQLATLVRKGYFEEDFTVPEAMVGIPWVLPMTSRVVFVEPDSMDSPPVVFLDLHNGVPLELDQHSSGYELSEYFPDVFATLGRDSERTYGPELESEVTQEKALDAEVWLDDSEDLLPDEAAPDVLFSEINDPEKYEDSVERMYLEKVARRLQSEPTSAGAPVSKGTPLFDGGLVAFEVEDGVLTDGQLTFDFEDVDLDLDYGDDEALPFEHYDDPAQQASAAQSRATRIAAIAQAAQVPESQAVQADADVDVTAVKVLERQRENARLSALRAERKALMDAGPSGPADRADQDLELE